MGQFDIEKWTTENPKIIQIAWVLSIAITNFGVEIEKCCAKVGP